MGTQGAPGLVTNASSLDRQTILVYGGGMLVGEFYDLYRPWANILCTTMISARLARVSRSQFGTLARLLGFTPVAYYGTGRRGPWRKCYDLNHISLMIRFLKKCEQNTGQSVIANVMQA